MQPLEIQNVIEEVTRRVIALSDSQSSNESAVATESKDAGIAQVDDKVISTQQLNDLPQGLTAIQVTAKSLITPAAADWLREQNIDVLRVDAQANGGDQNIDCGPDKWVRVTVGLAESVDLIDGSESFDCIVKAAGRCAEAIDNGERVVLVTDAVSLALISLNRNQKLRAIEVRHTSDLHKDADATCANIFVVDRQASQSTRLIKKIQLVATKTDSPPQWL
jgi:hypothetical protein